MRLIQTQLFPMTVMPTVSNFHCEFEEGMVTMSGNWHIMGRDPRKPVIEGSGRLRLKLEDADIYVKAEKDLAKEQLLEPDLLGRAERQQKEREETIGCDREHFAYVSNLSYRFTEPYASYFQHRFGTQVYRNDFYTAYTVCMQMGKDWVYIPDGYLHLFQFKKLHAINLGVDYADGRRGELLMETIDGEYIYVFLSVYQLYFEAQS